MVQDAAELKADICLLVPHGLNHTLYFVLLMCCKAMQSASTTYSVCVVSGVVVIKFYSLLLPNSGMQH